MTLPMVLRARAFRTCLAGAALVALAGLGCTACSGSPEAASVNGQVISEDALNQQLQQLAMSPAYALAFDNQQKTETSQLLEEGAVPSGYQSPTVAGSGSGPGNYGQAWSATVLNGLIYQAVIGQKVASEHRTASPAAVAAAFEAEQAANPQLWRQFPPGLRTALARVDAEHAMIEPAPSATTTKDDEQFYNKYRDDFWSRVCLKEVDVTVVSSSTGNVNWAASAREAQATVAAFEHGQVTSGQFYCLGPDQLLERGTTFSAQVGALPVGQAMALKGNDAYQVVYVSSKDTLAWDATTQAVVNVVYSLGGAMALGALLVPLTGDTTLVKLMDEAKVKLSPSYGEWAPDPPSPYAAQILPNQLVVAKYLGLAS